MTILVKKVFISSKPTFVYLLCPPLCGPFSIQESAAGGLSYKVKKQGSCPEVGRYTYLFHMIFSFYACSASIQPAAIYGTIAHHHTIRKVQIIGMPHRFLPAC